MPGKQLEDDAAVEHELPIAENASPEISAGLLAVRQADPTFSLSEFMAGARTAFEWVVDAFSKGEKEKLRGLLAANVFDAFAQEIDRQKKDGRRQETTLVAITSQEVQEAVVQNKQARITVRFVSDQVRVVRNPQGEIVEGDASDVQRVEDVWTFERPLSSRDPNWKIMDT